MIKKPQVPEQEYAIVFRKAADYCAIQDRCLSEMRQKLQAWGISKEKTNSIIERLLKEGFIDEQRFAFAFARGKFRNLNWGKIKIAAELQRRNIGKGQIARAINEIDETEYQEVFTKLLKKKTRELQADSIENRYKVMRFLAGKGFEPELIRKVMKIDF
jgi:regulatory protein